MLPILGGVTTSEIASAFLAKAATIAQRIVRAQQQLDASDEGMRDLSTLVVEVASQVSP